MSCMGDSEREVWTPTDVARAFKVDTKTVNRWAHRGLIPGDAMFRTPGGHFRFYADQMRELMVTMPSRGRWANTNRAS